MAWTLRSSGTANTLNGVAFGNQTYVAVGIGGTIVTSEDAATWDVQFSGTTATLLSVKFLNGQFFAVGANGTILQSLDGATWQTQNSGVSGTLKEITFGDGRFVACGSDRSLFTSATMNVCLQSTDGVNREDITTQVPANTGLNSITFLEGSFWIGGENGTILQSDSTDGIPRIAPKMVAGEPFQFQITLNAPFAFRIQSSTNLTMNSWQDIASISNCVPPFTWIDAAPAFENRFYRLVSP